MKILSIGLIAILQLSMVTCEDAAPADAAPADTGDATNPATGDGTPAPGGDAPANGDGAPAPVPTEPPKPKIECKKHLLETYGLEGLDHAKEMKLDMCGSVKNSCCKTSDQIAIFDNWVGAEEGKKLRERLDFHFKVYSELVLELEKSIPIASTLFSLTQSKSVSNCKLLSRRIQEYNIQMVGPRLKEAIRAMHSFFFDTYKGTYCSLCNADYQSFFHVETKTVKISPQFCRSIVANTLHVLTYLHVHMKKLSNLVAIMLTSCDETGKFVEEISVPVDLNFVVDDQDKRELYDCLKYRDDPKWLAYCGFICEEFHMSQYSEIFQPDLQRYKRLTKFLRTKFDKFLSNKKKEMNEKAEADKKADEKGEKKGEEKKKTEEKPKERILSRSKFVRDRYLEDAPKTDEKDKSEASAKKDDKGKKEGEEGGEGDGKDKGDQDDDEEKEEEEAKKKSDEEVKVDPADDNPSNIMDLTVQFQDLNVIRRSINACTPLERFESICSDEGIDPYAIGKEAQINEAVLETVKKLVELENKKPEPKPEPVKAEAKGFLSFIFG